MLQKFNISDYMIFIQKYIYIYILKKLLNIYIYIYIYTHKIIID